MAHFGFWKELTHLAFTDSWASLSAPLSRALTNSSHLGICQNNQFLFLNYAAFSASLILQGHEFRSSISRLKSIPNSQTHAITSWHLHHHAAWAGPQADAGLVHARQTVRGRQQPSHGSLTSFPLHFLYLQSQTGRFVPWRALLNFHSSAEDVAQAPCPASTQHKALPLEAPWGCAQKVLQHGLREGHRTAAQTQSHVVGVNMHMELLFSARQLTVQLTSPALGATVAQKVVQVKCRETKITIYLYLPFGRITFWTLSLQWILLTRD